MKKHCKSTDKGVEIIMLCQVIACSNVKEAGITDLVLNCESPIDYRKYYLIYKNIAYQIMPTFVIPHTIPHRNFHIPIIAEDITNTTVSIILKTQWQGTVRTF